MLTLSIGGEGQGSRGAGVHLLRSIDAILVLEQRRMILIYYWKKSFHADVDFSKSYF